MVTTQLIHGDCLKVMESLIKDGVLVDAIITDPPYGTTACKWDSVIPFDEMWARLKKLIKPNGAVVLFGSEPFSSALRMSNIKDYKYDWVWDKVGTANFAIAKVQPLRASECISVFSKESACYFPLMRKGKNRKKGGGGTCEINGMSPTHSINGDYFPTNVIRISNANFPGRGLHPTQKPVALMEYLIKTYTLPGETVLDFTMGSGSTGVAAKKLGRNFIGIELEAEYFEIAKNRINDTWAPGQSEPSVNVSLAEKSQLDIWDAMPAQ